MNKEEYLDTLSKRIEHIYNCFCEIEMRVRNLPRQENEIFNPTVSWQCKECFWDLDNLEKKIYVLINENYSDNLERLKDEKI